MELWRVICRILILISLILCIRASDDDFYKCAPQMRPFGYTYPRGDIVLEAGSPLEIFCNLNPALGYNSSALAFFHNDSLVPTSFINVVNETTIRLYIQNLPPSKSMFYCKLRHSSNDDDNMKAVCLNTVMIGLKPMEVRNFNCRFFNWENVNCTWENPMTYVNTSYTLSFYLGERNKYWYSCPSGNPSNSCLWTQHTSPHYRQIYAQYTFRMYIQNVFGSLTKTYVYDHYSSVVMKKADKLRLLEATYSSLQIQWSVPSNLHLFPNGTVHKVEYQSVWDPSETWHEVDTSSISRDTKEPKLNITNLPYAFSLYDIRVYMRPFVAKPPYVWSDPAPITLRTKATLPGAPPKTVIGSFEVVPQPTTLLRDVYIYWQQIPKYLENGESFEYKVISVEENGIARNITPANVTKTYAFFSGLTYNSYTFMVVSANKEGYSLDTSIVQVPSKMISPLEPVSFTKIAYDQWVYELSWRAPPVSSNIENYTIFWCENKRDRPFKCTGFLNWTIVDKEVTVKNITVPNDKIYQFAISANTKNSSSGMVWASCTVLPEQAGAKRKSIKRNNVGDTFVEMDWKLDCSDRIGQIQKFNIYFCPTVSPENRTCKEPIQNRTFDDGIEILRITGLKPYTTYIAYATAITKNVVSIQSDSLMFSTLESAPYTPPQNVNVIDATNTTISLSWSPPVSMNGKLRHYLVCAKAIVAGVETQVPCTKVNEDNQTSVTLINLSSYVVYNLTVQACTVGCSPQSPPISQRTAVGRPSTMDSPRVKLVNTSEISITWEPPKSPGGEIDYYNIKLELSDGKTTSESYYKSTKLETKIPTPECKGSSGSLVYSVSVQAVNIGPNGEVFAGPWSETGEGTCYYPFSTAMIVFISILGLLFFFAFCISLCYCTRLIWMHCKAMKNIDAKLPPRLAPLPVGTKAEDFQLPIWDTEPSKVAYPIAPPDQQLLLSNKGKEEQGDSGAEAVEDAPEGDHESGCGSSGQDSAASSITAGTNISSDSGTEADQRAQSPIPRSAKTPPSQDCLLRQRNVSAGGSTPEGYVMVLQRPSSNYVAQTRGYVTHPPTWPTPEPPPKGYVVAAPPPDAPAPAPSSFVVWEQPLSPHSPLPPAKPDRDSLLVARSFSDVSAPTSPCSN